MKTKPIISIILFAGLITTALHAQPQSGRPWTVPGLNLEMMPIAAGSLQMGANNGDSDEKPIHAVLITKPFWLGKYEVTQGQWKMLMGTTVREQRDKARPDWSLREQGADFPMYYVSWNEAMEFCQKLTQRERAAGRLPEGYEYTLPTEAQWEYACRAGTDGDYGGSGSLDEMGWHNKNSGNKLHPVGRKQANGWGLHDMHGGMWEWCLDRYDEGYYANSPAADPRATGGAGRVLRGGGWSNAAERCRSAARSWDSPGIRYNHTGFRLALTPHSSAL